MKGIAIGVGLLLCAVSGTAGAEQGGAETASGQVAAKGVPQGVSAAPPGGGANEKVAAQLDTFCKKWMGFLAVREHDNRGKVSWKPASDGVEGEYVGYGTDYTCSLKENPDPKAVPVATIKYKEFLYRRRGTSAEQAMVTAPDVLEATEVTEIFRYAKGEWVY